MTTFLIDIGERIYRALWGHFWSSEIVNDTLLYYVFLQLCCCLGLFGLFTKMNVSRWWAVLPAANVERLGETYGRRLAGVVTGLCNIALLPVCDCIVRIDTVPYQATFQVTGMAFLMLAGILLVRMIAGLFLYGPLITRFNKRKIWHVFFLFFPEITLLFWGLNTEIRE